MRGTGVWIYAMGLEWCYELDRLYGVGGDAMG